MNTLIVNCAEHSNLLSTIEGMIEEGDWVVEKIIDYPEYKHRYKHLNAEFESFYDHIRLKNVAYLISQYRFISKNLIIFSEKYLKSALDILKVRHVKNGITFGDDEALMMFYGSLNRSISEIETKKIDLIVFNHVPHHFNTYVLYVAAKYLGVKTLIVTKLCWNGFRYFLDSSIGERGWSIKNNIKCCDQTLLEDRIQCDEIRNRRSYSKPIYMAQRYNRRLVSLLAKYFDKYIFFHIGVSIFGGIEIGLFKRMPCHFKWRKNNSYIKEKYPMKVFQVADQITQKFRIKKLSKIYDELSSKIDFNETRYVLFAPNYQPEATTLPTSLYFYDILLCIKLIRSRLPDDILIIYKEHEDIFNISLEGDKCRSREFYENLLSINKVVIASRCSSQIELIDNSQFVAIQTSNIGLESLIRGKPVMNFGATWFDDFTGITNWDDFDVANGYEKIVLNAVEVNLERFSDVNKYTVRLENALDSEREIFKMKSLFRQALEEFRSSIQVESASLKI